MYTSVTPEIKAIGVTDTAIDLFESQYPVPQGITYNSYLIDTPAPVIMDAVEASFADEWLGNLDGALDGRDPAAMVVSHMEPDHSGAIDAAMTRYPAMRLIVSARAKTMLPAFFPDSYACWSDRVETVADGDTREIAPGHLLRFVMAPMVHWPEVMVTLDLPSGTLFSADAFGTFGNPAEPQPSWTPEAARYYFNIVGKYGAQVQSLLGKLGDIGIRMICPLHGPVLQGRNVAEAIALYYAWSRYLPDTAGALVAYGSVYGHTARAAEAMADELCRRGVADVMLLDLARCDMSLALSEAFRRPVTVLAAATYEGGLFPPVAELLHHLASKGWRDRRVGLIQNGSWAPAAARVMTGMLDTMKEIDIARPVVTLKTSMDADSLSQIARLADSLLSDPEA